MTVFYGATRACPDSAAEASARSLLLAGMQSFIRRRILGWAPALLLAARKSAADAADTSSGVLTVYTFGDSILDCGHYNAHGITPGELIVRNDDKLFPEFKGRDLQSKRAARLEHRARDGATVAGLPSQARGIKPRSEAVALLTIGGNDLIGGLAGDTGAGMRKFETALDAFVRALPIRPVLMGTVYDPTFADDSKNFLGVPAKIARANHRRVNDIIGTLASRYGKLADLHAHFLRGDPSWFTRTIEPSLIGASEIRRVFLAAI